MVNSKIIGAVEIGTSKVVVLIGEIVNGKTLNIVGMGVSSSRGVKKSEIIDFNAASDCTHATIMAAEESAGVRVDAVYLAQSGRHLDTFFNDAEVTVKSSENIVHRSDIRRLLAEAKSKLLPEDRAIIHHIRNGFQLDGQPVDNPEHLEGHKLGIGYWNIHGSVKKMSDSIHIINGFGLQVEDLIVSCLASGKMVTTDEEQKCGVLVIDIGGGSTDYVLFKNGYVVYSGVIAVGGDHITNDLSIGLRTNAKLAEMLKVKNGKASLEPKSKNDKVMLIGDLTIGDRSISRASVCQIINARLDELFKLIRGDKHIAPFFSKRELASVVLTGGTSKLKEIEKLGEKVFGLPVTRGENPSWVASDLAGPEYSTTLGLLYFGFSYKDESRFSEQRKRTKFIKGVKQLLGF
ncbi:MAG: cell division protein FtsA [Verrucomicrobia bacterium]|nr:cell division protein FtsA [Verrucomicrobiota bacterium]